MAIYWIEDSDSGLVWDAPDWGGGWQILKVYPWGKKLRKSKLERRIYRGTVGKKKDAYD